MSDDVTTSLERWKNILRADPCCYCGKPSKDADHIQPLCYRGQNHPNNLAGVCRHCNASKGSKSVLAMLSGLRVGRDHRYELQEQLRKLRQAPTRLNQKREERQRDAAARERRFRSVYSKKYFDKYGRLPSEKQLTR